MEPAGYRLLFAADGADAVNVLLSEPGEIDAVLLDLNLPQLGGVDVYRHIRATRADAKVIVVSGNLTPEIRRELSDLGQTDFIAKPYNLAEVGRRLRKRLD
jgi:DNA-binding response OmpR family regulator